MNSELLNVNNISIDSTGWPVELPVASERERRKKRTVPWLLLVDDDPIFRRKIERTARQKHIQLTTCGSIQEMEVTREYTQYDIALIDYYLGDTTASKVLPKFKDKVPVIVISESASVEVAGAHWPPPVERFVSKSEGMEAILDEALKVINMKSGDANAAQLKAVNQTLIEKAEFLLIFAAAIACFMCSVFVLSRSGFLNTTNRTYDIKLDPVPINKWKTPIKWDQAPVVKATEFG